MGMDDRSPLEVVASNPSMVKVLYRVTGILANSSAPLFFLNCLITDVGQVVCIMLSA